MFRYHSKIWYVDLRTNSDFRSRSFDLFPPTQVIQSIKRVSDMSPFPLVPRGPLGRLCSDLAKRGRSGANTQRERRSRSDRSGSWFCDGEDERAYTGYAPNYIFAFKKCFCRCRQLPCPFCQISMPLLDKIGSGNSHILSRQI